MIPQNEKATKNNKKKPVPKEEREERLTSCG
jgi:hypothetical protein